MSLVVEQVEALGEQGDRHLGLRDQPVQQRRLAGAVGSDHPDPVRPVDLEVVALEHHPSARDLGAGQVDPDLPVLAQPGLGGVETFAGLLEPGLVDAAQPGRRLLGPVALVVDLRLAEPGVGLRLLGHPAPPGELPLGLARSLR